MESEVAISMREQIKDYVMDELVGVEIGLNNMESSTNMDENSFDEYSYYSLSFMSRSELEKYATYCRDMYKCVKAQEI